MWFIVLVATPSLPSFLPFPFPQHRGVADHYPNVRVGHRVIISGDRPYWDPDTAVEAEKSKL